MDEDSSLPSVSIIILNHNGINLLGRCLSSIIKTSYPNFEIVIVDNNSTDGSPDFIRKNFPSCRIIALDHNEGFSRANNIAAKDVSSKYVLFLNNDTFVTDGHWLGELVRVIDRDDSIVIAQSLLMRPTGEVDSSGDFATKRGITYNSKIMDSKNPRLILSARGASMIVRREFFLSVGGFDDDYYISFEDVELGWKANIWGYKVVMVPTSVVYHLGGTTTRNMSEIITFHGLKNQLSLLTTHFETGRAVTNLILYFARLLLRFFKLTFKLGKNEEMFVVDKSAVFRAIMWYFRNFGTIRAKAKHINKLRKKSTSELVEIGVIS